MGFYTNDSVLEGVKHPSRRKAIPNTGEELYGKAWEIVRDEVYKLQNRGWSFDEKGNAVLSNQNYKGANIYFYLIHYATIMRNWLEDTSMLNGCFDLCRWKIDCVEGNLACLSNTYGTDYVTAWAEIKELYGLNLQEGACTDCCKGIGQMIINDHDDCEAFIVGDCDEAAKEEVLGAFSPCEFKVGEFNNDVNTDYSICN